MTMLPRVVGNVSGWLLKVGLTEFVVEIWVYVPLEDIGLYSMDFSMVMQKKMGHHGHLRTTTSCLWCNMPSIVLA